MTESAEMRLVFMGGLLLLGVAALLVAAIATAAPASVARMLAAWRGHRGRAPARAAESAAERSSEARPREQRLVTTRAR